MRCIGVALLCVLVSGCAAVRNHYIRQALRQVKQDCDSRGFTSRVELTRCKSEKLIAVYERYGYPYMDLIEVIAANEIALAQKLDDGTVTDDEANLQRAEVYARINSEIQRRDAAWASVAAAQQAATSAFFQSHRSPRLMCMDLGGILHCQ
jgi:hypothetical protein